MTTKVAQKNQTKNYTIRVRVKFQAYDHFVLDKVVSEVAKAIKNSGSEMAGPIPLPSLRKRFDALKSPFVYKNHWSQYEMTTHQRFIDVFDPNSATLNTLQKLDIPSGVKVDIKMIS
ncbi:MAG: 30S ribosomal protein S10 [Patescibacteria group bacterium]